MAIVVDPDAVQLFWLESDADKPKETRPMFEVRTPNRRMRNQLDTLRRKAASLEAEAARLSADGKDDEADAAAFQKWSVLMDMALLGVTGWQNVGGKAFTPDADCLDGVLEDNSDLIDLALNWPDAGRMTEDDRKNSSSPRDTDAEKSAADAVAEPALTNPTPTNPSDSTSPVPPAPASTPPAPSVEIVIAPGSS